MLPEIFKPGLMKKLLLFVRKEFVKKRYRISPECPCHQTERQRSGVSKKDGQEYKISGETNIVVGWSPAPMSPELVWKNIGVEIYAKRCKKSIRIVAQNVPNVLCCGRHHWILIVGSYCQPAKPKLPSTTCWAAKM